MHGLLENRVEVLRALYNLITFHNFKLQRLSHWIDNAKDAIFSACFSLPVLPSNSPGDIELRPVGNTATTSPFLLGDAFSYVCVDDVNFQLTPTSNLLTSCEVGGSFTHDASPPVCQQISTFNFDCFAC